MQTGSIGFQPRSPQPTSTSAATNQQAVPDMSQFSGDFPAELFTPEALAACPHAKAMFEQMQKMGKFPTAQQPAPQEVKLAESDSWVAAKAPGNFQPVTTASANWTPKSEIQSILAGAAKNVPDNKLSGRKEADFRTFTRERIDHIQKRQVDNGAEAMDRLVHTDQLFGGEVEVHWNPNLEEMVELFGQPTTGGLVRVSDASNTQNPDGKSMYGMALELVGNDGQLTDILMTGGSPHTEASQAKDPEAQLALFNMLDHPNKVGGLVQMAWEVGAIEAGKMIIDVGRMKEDLNSVSDLTAWSRAPFRLKGKDGNHYLVKMRATPAGEKAPEAQAKEGQTTSDRLTSEFREKASTQDTRWNFDIQFMQPGDNPNDGRETWSGPWVTAGEVVIPKIADSVKADEMSQAADDTKFNIWKGKQDHDKGPDSEVFYPHGWTNQARLWAYGQSAKNRGVAG
jgi:hypothetical protein